MSAKTAIVIGAGVLGCSLAAELTRNNVQVTLIDEAEIASGTSAATFAWVNGNNKSPENYSHLNFLGLQAHERASAAGARWFHQTGMVQVAQSNDEAEGYERNVKNIAWPEYGARPLTRAEVLHLEPSLNADRVVGGAFYPREGWIDVQTMCHSLAEMSIEQGASFHPFESVQEIRGNEVVTECRDGSLSTYAADVIIVAAGNGTPHILRSVGIDFPLLDPHAHPDERGSVGSSVGVISTTGKVNTGIRHFVRTRGVALRPSRNGGITFSDHPTGGQWAQDDPRTWQVPQTLLERAKALYPSLKGAVTKNVALGTRVLPSDGLTVVDWVGSGAPVYAVATHSGVTLSAHLAETIVKELLTGRRDESVQPFGLERFKGYVPSGARIGTDAGFGDI